MGKWQLKLLKVTLKSPLRCGDSPMGFVARTLPFVPSHIPLMAMVPSALNLLNLPAETKNYKMIQTFLESSIKFTPFFIHDESSDMTLFPYENSRELQDIESRYMGARQRVALDYNKRSARESMLFETEAINPVASNGCQTVLSGYMFWREIRHDSLEIDGECRLKGFDLTDIILNSQWGGERNIGFGRIASVESFAVDEVWGEPVILDDQNPEIKWPECKPAPFWLEYGTGNTIEGNVKPLSGRLHDPDKGRNGAGQAVWKPIIVWDIGWRANKPVNLKPGVFTMSM